MADELFREFGNQGNHNNAFRAQTINQICLVRPTERGFVDKADYALFSMVFTPDAHAVHRIPPTMVP